MREKSSSEFFRGFCPGIIWWTHARTYFTAIGCYWLLLVSTPIKGCNPPKKSLGETTSSTNSYQRLNGRKSGKDACHQRFLLPSCGRFASRAAHMVSAWRSGGKCQLTCSQSVKKARPNHGKKIRSYKVKSMGWKEKVPFQLHSTDFISGWLVFQPIPALPYIFRSFLQEWHTTIFRARTALERCYLPWPPQKNKDSMSCLQKNCQSILYQSSSHEHPFIRLFRWSHWFEAVKAEVCI